MNAPRSAASRMTALVSVVVATVLVGSSLAAPLSPASAATTDLPVVLDLADLSAFADTGGTPIGITSDQTVDAERTVEGTGADGSPVQIKIYSAAPANIGAADLVALASDTSPVTDDLTVHPLDPQSLEPQVVAATTPTTVSVSWKAPEGADQFALFVNDELAAQGAEPNFTLTGLVPDQSYSLSMRSTHEATEQAPETPPSPTTECPNPEVVRTTNLSTWDLSQTRSAGHNELTVSGLHVFTDDSSSQAKAAGYLSTNVPLDSVTASGLVWVGSPVAPGLQLVVDFDGNGTLDGILVGESVYGADFWASNASAAFVKTGAPSHTSGFGSANHGLLPDWSTAFPNAQVKAIGYSLGSGVLGDGVIESITIGCITYTFATEPDPNGADQPVDTSMELSIATRTETAPTARRGGPSSSQDAGSKVSSTEFRYQTFIPYARLSDSPDLRDHPIETSCIALYQARERLAGNEVFDDNPLDLTFRGDDRPYTEPLPGRGDNYRTSMLFRWDWETSTPTSDQAAGLTQILRKSDGTVVAEKRANTDRMIFRDVTSSSDSVSVVFSHVANDPFCPSGADVGVNPALGSITYKVRVTMFKSGLVIVEGSRATMPAHEGWVRWNDQTKWSNVVALKATRLACLVQAEVPVLNLLSGCIERMSGTMNRSTDKWVATSFNSDSGTIALAKSGRTYGWGGYRGGLIEPFAQGTCNVLEVVEVPRTADGKTIRATKLAAENRNGIALAKDGRIVTWGIPSFGNLGRPGDPSSAAPVSSTQFAAFDTFGQTTFAVSSTGDLYTWGPQFFDYFSNPNPKPPARQTPTLVASGYGFVDVAVADGTVLILDGDGNLGGYGNNLSGLLGDNTLDTWVPQLQQIPAATTFVQLAATQSSAFALDSNGRAWTWGTLLVPVVGAPQTDGTSPALVDTSVRFTSITSGFNLISTTGAGYYVNPYADAAPIESQPILDPGDEVIYLDGSLAINSHGELLSLEGYYDPNLQQYIETGWSNRGLPPVKTPLNPPRECFSDN